MPTLAAALLLATLPSQILDNEGTEFLCGFLPNAFTGAGLQVELHLTGQTASSVTIEYPSGAPTFTTNVMVAPGAITVVPLPRNAARDWVADTVLDNLVSIQSANEISAYMVNRFPFSSDAALALPVDVLNTSYILADFEPQPQKFRSHSEFCVFARFDDTVVTITPSNELVGGHLAGVPFQVTLEAGEGYFVEALNTGPLGSISGTLVEATRVIGVTNGARCSNIPNLFGFCDHIFEVAQPTQTWGSRYLVANVPNRPTGSIYRVFASVDDTVIQVDGATQGTIDRGEFIQVGPTANDSIIESAGGEPIFVVQFMTSNQFGGTGIGDPAMGNVTPPAQFKRDYTFSTVGGAQFSQHALTVIAADTDLAAITLDGTPIGSPLFTSIGTSGFSVARVVIAEGSHATSSPNGHGVMVQGFNVDDSYMYPGGARFAFINPVGDANPPIVTTSVVGGIVQGRARDDRPTEDSNGNGVLDPGEDLNGNNQIDVDTGVFFISLDEGFINLEVVAAFASGDPVVDFVVRRITSTTGGSGTLVVTDGAGNETRVNLSLGGGAESMPPICTTTLVSPGRVDGLARDNRPGDSGLLRVELVAGSSNLLLFAPAFNLGAPSVTWSVGRQDSLLPATGVVRVLDLAGNETTCPISLAPAGDCNGNGVPDAQDLASFTSYDWNGNAIPDECEQLGRTYCSPAEHNSTGLPSYLIATGSNRAPTGPSDTIRLDAYNLPSSAFGFFAVSSAPANINGRAIGVSWGNICISTTGGFLSEVRFAVNGSIGIDASVSTLSFPGFTLGPGSTLYFQAWYRDSGTLIKNNFTDAVEVRFY